MALVGTLVETHFNEISISNIEDCSSIKGLIVSVSIFEDDLNDGHEQDIVPRDQLDKWVKDRTLPRRSSLKDTSLTKFPETPKTKKVRWGKNQPLVTFCSYNEDVEETTEKRERQIFQHTTKSSIECNDNALPPTPKISAQVSLQVIPATFTINNPPLSSKKGQLAPNQQHVSNSESSSAEITPHVTSNSDKNINPPQPKGFAFQFVKAFWFKLKDRLNAISTIQLITRDWLCKEVFFYDDDQDILLSNQTTRHSISSTIPLDEDDDDLYFHTSFQEVERLLSMVRLPKRITWNHPISPCIRDFECKAPHSSCRHKKAENPSKSWVQSLLTWAPFIFTSTFVSEPKPTSKYPPRPGLHSRRSTDELLEVRKLFRKIRQREQRKRLYMIAHGKGRRALELLGCGSGLPVIFEEEGSGNGEAALECWKCDTCEVCLIMALRETHPCWRKLSRKYHTCCPPDVPGVIIM